MHCQHLKMLKRMQYIGTINTTLLLNTFTVVYGETVVQWYDEMLFYKDVKDHQAKTRL